MHSRREAWMCGLLIALSLAVLATAGETVSLEGDSGAALVEELREVLAPDLGGGKELPNAKLRKPVKKVLKSNMKDGPKMKKPTIKKHKLPSKKQMADAAFQTAMAFKKRNAAQEAKENRDKVNSVKARERARKSTQPQPPKPQFVALKLIMGSPAERKAKALKRNVSAEKQRKRAEFERGKPSKVKVKVVKPKDDGTEARMKASERASKA